MKITKLILPIILFSTILSCEIIQPDEDKIPTCDSMILDFQNLIENEFNYCELDKDCKVINGICPLGCFFIVHERNMEDVEKMKAKVKEKCGECFYKCLPPPQKIKCINKVCHPDIEEKYVYFLFGSDCDKIVEMYSQDIVGKTYEEINLHMLDFEIIKKDSISNLKRAPKGRINNLKLIVDESGIIESVSCLEKK